MRRNLFIEIFIILIIAILDIHYITFIEKMILKIKRKRLY